ncbi:MAG TPA: hypothetical protein VFX60_09965 [Micromonospora sp.]|nr:hypothetical protein [Micromonospora sp.]
MPEESYAFTERAYLNLAKAEVRPLAVTDVLYGRPAVRRHIGAVLQIAGQDRDGTWLAVALIEGNDDEYAVVSARYLDDDEITTITQLLRRDP